MKRFMTTVAGLTVALLALPLLGLLQRMPWSSLGNPLTNPATLDALRVSLIVSLLATVMVFC